MLWSEQTVFSRISTLGESQEGELYLKDFFAGTVYRFVSPSSILADRFASDDLRVWSQSAP